MADTAVAAMRRPRGQACCVRMSRSPTPNPYSLLPTPMRRWFIGLWIVACLAGLFVACYGRAIFRGEQFAYRDAAHYYDPLHQRVQAEWVAGRWPLWEL